MQLLNCKCSGICSETNFFTLTHKGQTTVHIKETATVETVQAALQQLTTLRDAVVTFSGSQACVTGQGNDIRVRFNLDFGTQPLLTYTQVGSAVMIMEISREVTGTKEEIECANRGICVLLTYDPFQWPAVMSFHLMPYTV